MTPYQTLLEMVLVLQYVTVNPMNDPTVVRSSALVMLFELESPGSNNLTVLFIGAKRVPAIEGCLQDLENKRKCSAIGQFTALLGDFIMPMWWLSMPSFPG